jgi:hypothetical protein
MLQAYVIQDPRSSDTRHRRAVKTSATSGSTIFAYRQYINRHSALASQSYALPRPKPDRFTEYEAYSVDDWDGYGAQPILSTTVALARSFFDRLPRGHLDPDVAPGGDGSIGFEWVIHCGREQQMLYVDVRPGEDIEARRIGESGAVVETFAAKNAELSAFADRIARMLR